MPKPTKLFLAAISAAAIAALAALGATPAGATTSTDAAMPTKGWGEASDSTNLALGQLQDFLAQTYEDSNARLGGMWVDPDGMAIHIAVVGGSAADETRNGIANYLKQAAPGLPFEFVEVERSFDDLMVIADRVVGEFPTSSTVDTAVLGSVDTDVVHNKVAVHLLPGNAAAAERLEARFGQLVAVDELGALAVALSSDVDPAPHKGGAGFTTWNQAHNLPYFDCSVGFPVTIAGAHYMATAGHCQPAAASSIYPELWNGSGFPNSLYYVGLFYTTTWVGTQQLHGDWSLANGSTYQAKVYNGPTITSSSTLNVTASNFLPAAVGQQVCGSGHTTSQTCRYFVATPNTSYTLCIGNSCWSTAFGVALLHDSDLNGSYDCLGFQAGDSGGSGYYANASGGVTAFGLVSGGTPCTAGGRRTT